MSRPTEPTPTPSVVTDIAAGRPVDAVWVNELGGLTFAIAGGSENVKATPPQWAHGLEAEVCRLGWAATYLQVPRAQATVPRGNLSRGMVVGVQLRGRLARRVLRHLRHRTQSGPDGPLSASWEDGD